MALLKCHFRTALVSDSIMPHAERVFFTTTRAIVGTLASFRRFTLKEATRRATRRCRTLHVKGSCSLASRAFDYDQDEKDFQKRMRPPCNCLARLRKGATVHKTSPDGMPRRWVYGKSPRGNAAHIQHMRNIHDATSMVWLSNLQRSQNRGQRVRRRWTTHSWIATSCNFGTMASMAASRRAATSAPALSQPARAERATPQANSWA